jgi:hypothetical protein
MLCVNVQIHGDLDDCRIDYSIWRYCGFYKIGGVVFACEYEKLKLIKQFFSRYSAAMKSALLDSSKHKISITLISILKARRGNN